MSGFSEMAREVEQADFIRKWAPGKLPELTEGNLRWNIARANAAESELRELKGALRIVKEAIR